MNVSSVALPNLHRFYAQALCAGGIGPDIIFTANIQDLNIALVDGLNLDDPSLLLAMDTSNQIIALPFKEIFYICISKILSDELDAACRQGVL